MPDLRDFTHIKAVRREGHHQPILYGASSPDGPWFRLSKRETAFITRHADRIIPATDVARETQQDTPL